MNEIAPQEEVVRAGAAPVFADVLCAISGREGGFTAVDQAAALAGPAGQLTLLAVTSFRSEGAHRSPAISPTEATRLLDRAKQIAQEAGVPFTSEVDPASPPSQVVLDWSARYELLALGAPVNSWLRGLFVGGVGDTALGAVVTPLLISRPTPAERRFADRILVASDCLDGSQQLVALAGRLAGERGASVILLHATGHESHLRHGGREEHAQRLQEQADSLQRALGEDVFEVRSERGSAHEVIVSAATSTGASLVMMGSRRLGGLRAIGSVSRRVAHDAPCSVLLVPPEQLTPRASAEETQG
jgi:nucleotide-binding universal stress UspA family protein